MWVSRYDSWGKIKQFVLWLLVKRSENGQWYFKNPRTLSSILAQNRVEPTCHRLQRQNDVSEVEPRMVHHVKVTDISLQRGLDQQPKRNTMLNRQELYFSSMQFGMHQRKSQFRLKFSLTLASYKKTLSERFFKQQPF